MIYTTIIYIIKIVFNLRFFWKSIIAFIRI